MKCLRSSSPEPRYPAGAPGRAGGDRGGRNLNVFEGLESTQTFTRMRIWIVCAPCKAFLDHLDGTVAYPHTLPAPSTLGPGTSPGLEDAANLPTTGSRDETLRNILISVDYRNLFHCVLRVTACCREFTCADYNPTYNCSAGTKAKTGASVNATTCEQGSDCNKQCCEVPSQLGDPNGSIATAKVVFIGGSASLIPLMDLRVALAQPLQS